MSIDIPGMGTADWLGALDNLDLLAAPVAALREMRRVTRPGGIVAARDSVHSAQARDPQPAAWTSP